MSHSRAKKILGLAGLIAAICITTLVLTFLVVEANPALGAQGADLLRSLIGDKAVAGLEMKFNQVQDGFQKLKYSLGLERPAVPWTTLPIPTSTSSPAETWTSTHIIPTPLPIQATAIPPISNTPQPTFTPTPSPWLPDALAPLGTAEGEGVWTGYIQDAAGQTVAYRTFLQPDPDRPYTLVAVVAIDLTHTRLHYVLGSIEPAGEDTPPRTGAIPKADRLPNVLLAAFNGGFKARHGQFGAMADGIMPLPPRVGFGTLVIYQNGNVTLSEWGTDSAITPDMEALRQNGPLVIHEGQINPRIYNNSPQDWGYTVNDVSPTVRTGVGLSADKRTLFYFCGPSLSMEMLAKTMQAAGAWNAIQLDINNYWALFVTFHPFGATVVPEALLPHLMVANIERYLWDYTRDYFYLTNVAR